MNVATMSPTSTYHWNSINELCDKFGDKLNILCFPCNQFSHTQNDHNKEILNTLKNVRPGKIDVRFFKHGSFYHFFQCGNTI